MEMAAANLIEPGDRALVVDTGYFSEPDGGDPAPQRRRGDRGGGAGGRGAAARARSGQRSRVAGTRPFKALFATHVDTSTGVRVDPEPLCRLAREAGALAVFDGVCATAGERFEMAGWGADLYFTGSQKALGVPPGLALLVAGERALAARGPRARPRRRRSSSTGTPGSPSTAPTRSASRATSRPRRPRWSWRWRPASARSWRTGVDGAGSTPTPAPPPPCGPPGAPSACRSVPRARRLTANTLSALYFPAGDRRHPAAPHRRPRRHRGRRPPPGDPRRPRSASATWAGWSPSPTCSAAPSTPSPGRSTMRAPRSTRKRRERRSRPG